MTRFKFLLVAAGLMWGIAATAQDKPSAPAETAGGSMMDHSQMDHSKMGPGKMDPSKMDSQDASSSSALADGEVKKVDKDAGKLTIKHGPLVNLDMPGMTMVFRVKDPAMLDQVKPGDRVRFKAEKLDAGFTVTRLESK